jgi:hypothetical protein
MPMDYNPPTRAPILFCFGCAKPRQHRYVMTVDFDGGVALSHEFACEACGLVRRWGFDRPRREVGVSDAYLR